MLGVILQVIPFSSKAQLKKVWGHWITDTAIGHKQLNTVSNSLVIDEDDNIYVQFSRGGSYDTVFLQSYSSTGRLRWERKVYWQDSTERIFSYKSDLKYDKFNHELQYNYSKQSGDQHYLVRSFFSRSGKLLRRKETPVERSFYYNQKKSILDDVGNLIIVNEKVQDISVAIINKNGERIERSFKSDLDSAHVLTNHVYGLANYDDEHFVIQFITHRRLLLSNIYYVNLHLVRKDDLQSKAFSVNRASLNSAEILVKNGNIYVSGVDFFKFNSRCELLERKLTFRVFHLLDIPDGMFVSHWGPQNYGPRKFDAMGNEIWVMQQANYDLESYESLGYHPDCFVVTGKYFIQYPGQFSTITEAVAIKTRRINNERGNVEEVYSETVDTARGQLGEVKSVLDSKGNSIILAHVTFIGERDSLNVRPTKPSLYLYKVCKDCDDVVDVRISDANFIQVTNNPSRDLLTYHFKIVTPGRVSFLVYDVEGNIVYKEYHKSYTPGYYKRSIDLASLGLAMGSYFLSMRTTYNSYTSKFVYSP